MGPTVAAGRGRYRCPGMRRTLFILALVVAPLLDAGPAGAHVCAEPVEVAVGEPVTIPVGVGAEVEAVTAIEIELPDGFRLTEAEGEEWGVDVGGDAVRFTGSSIAPFQCGQVVLMGVARERDTLVFPLMLETADGQTVTYESDDPFREDSGQLVYAGVPAPSLAESTGSGDGGGTDAVQVAGWALLGAGGVLGVVLGVSQWRRRGVEHDRGV